MVGSWFQVLAIVSATVLTKAQHALYNFSQDFGYECEVFDYNC